MAGEGQMLRDAREEKSWSLLKAEESTKIRVRYLQALEEENYDILPGPAYAKGFLRTYAKNLGLDPEKIVELYKSSRVVPEAVPVLETPLVPPKSRPLWFRPTVAAVMAVFAVILVISITHWSSSPQGKISTSEYTPAPLPSAPKTEPVKGQPKTTVKQSTPAPTNQPTNPSNAVAATTDGLTAELVFSQPCWLLVQADGQQALQGTYAAGTTKEIKANTKIELVTVGNAGGVTVTLNGKTLPTLGNAGQVVRNVVLTKSTLAE